LSDLAEKLTLEQKDIPEIAANAPSNVTDAALKYLELLYGQIVDHKAIRDRWFRYYLLLIGIPLGLIIPLTQASVFSTSISNSTLLMSALSALFLTLGIIFFLLFIKQRLNYLAKYHKAIRVETEIVIPYLRLPVPTRYHSTSGNFFADIYANSVHILLNSVWVSIGTASLTGLAGASHTIAFGAAAGAFLISWIAHLIIRQQFLKNIEAPLINSEQPDD
ncbi:MAG: hypothetical protein AAGJ87_13300, partial [Pseudomonadota bacterium]